LLLDQAFLALWGVGALNSTGRWLDMLVIAIFVLDRTGSPLLVASMLVLRLLPMAMFGLFGGVIAHRFERWGILRLASACAALLALGIYLLAVSDSFQVWHAGIASFVSGMVWSTDFPVRRTLIGDIAGPERVGRAMSIDILAGSGTRMLGPLLGGVLYQEVGLDGAFLLSATLYLAGLAILMVQHRERVEQPPVEESVRDNLRNGWRVLRQSDILPGILAVTVVFNLWGFPFVSMVPVFAKEVFALSDSSTGFLVSVEGAGALLGALALSLFARYGHTRYYYVGAVVSYCLFALAFSLSSWIWVSAALLTAVGFVSAAFGSMQSALILMNAPTGFERQMMGVLSVCIGTAPLGFIQIGLLADWLGVAEACTVTAVTGVAAMLIVVRRWPNLIGPQPIKGGHRSEPPPKEDP
jgi:predicted MFS family arabinose efflux permease